MYLGGNGLFGVTSVDPRRPHVIEVRRWGTSWPFEMPPGERYHSTTGEPGGTWRNRGWAPNRFVGVGSCAAGFDRGAPYVRQPGSFDPRAAFIFEGIGPDEAIGDFPSLMVQHGAAGYEMDRLDFSLGTPPRTPCCWRRPSATRTATTPSLTNACSSRKGLTGYSRPHRHRRACCTPSFAPIWSTSRHRTGVRSSPLGPSLGAAASRITTTTTTVSRITENVLRRFAEVEPGQ